MKSFLRIKIYQFKGIFRYEKVHGLAKNWYFLILFLGFIKYLPFRFMTLPIIKNPPLTESIASQLVGVQPMKDNILSNLIKISIRKNND